MNDLRNESIFRFVVENSVLQHFRQSAINHPLTTNGAWPPPHCDILALLKSTIDGNKPEQSGDKKKFKM